METTYRLNTKELGDNFINSLRYTYPDQDIEIFVREQNETEYLCRSPANREHLEKSILEVEQGKVITFSTLEDAITCAQSKNKK
ncbi:MAG: hypothetical protein FWD40_11415 [Treponema sp.]|nr:hypothetical protein [Treponema sp.]